MKEEPIARALGGKQVGSQWMAPCPAQRLPRNQLVSPEANPCRLASTGTTVLIQDSTDNVTRLAGCVAAAPARTHGHRPMPDRVNQGGHGHG